MLKKPSVRSKLFLAQTATDQTESRLVSQAAIRLDNHPRWPRWNSLRRYWWLPTRHSATSLDGFSVQLWRGALTTSSHALTARLSARSSPFTTSSMRCLPHPHSRLYHLLLHSRLSHLYQR